MFKNVNVCFLVAIETHMLAADLEGTALRIGCAKQVFHLELIYWFTFIFPRRPIQHLYVSFL